MAPTQEECEKVIENYLKDPLNAKFKEWYESDLDIREFNKIDRNPLMYVKELANKFIIGEEIEPYTKYNVTDINLEKEGLPCKFLAYFFEDKYDWDACNDLYTKYKCLDNINKRIEFGMHEIVSIELKTIYYIIVDIPTNTLR
jgi:hypothetical protein